MKTKILPVIAELKHISFGWYSSYLTELSKCALKRGYIVDVIYNVSELSRFEGLGYVVVMGVDGNWLDEVFEHLEAMGLQGIVEHGNSLRSSLFEIQTDQQSLVRQSVQLFYDNGRTNIAMFGVKRYDTSDKVKVDAFLEECDSAGVEDVYYTDNNIAECFEEFKRNAHKYNAVICVDDIVGVYFIGACKKAGINIPEDIYVTGNGNVRLRSFCNPTLTTFVNRMDDEKTRPEVFMKVYEMLARYPQISFLRLGGKAQIIEGESTGGERGEIAKKRNFVDGDEEEFMDLQDIKDPDVRKLCIINRALTTCDDVDIKILSMQAVGENYIKTAAALYISVDTVKYRIRRIYKRFNVSGRTELIDLINKYELRF